MPTSIQVSFLLLLSFSCQAWGGSPEDPAVESVPAAAPTPETEQTQPVPASQAVPSPEPSEPSPGGEDTLTTRAPTRGELLDAATGKPIRGARIHVRGTSVTVFSDRDGHFQLPPLTTRIQMLEIEARGYGFVTAPVRVRSDEPLPAIRLNRVASGSGLTTDTIEVVETLVETPQTVERVLTLPELQRVPGSFNDAIRAVQNLPGVARNPIGVLIVRGTEPQDTGYYVDGIRVPNIFHFFGLHTVINTDVLQQVTFLPGNYSVRYGRTFGGVVDAITSEDIPQAYAGYLGIDLINTVAFARVPLNKSNGLMLSFRRGYADFILEKGLALVEDIRGQQFDLGIRQAPKYWDYQALYNGQLNEKNFVHVLLFGSNDTLRIVASPPASIRPEVRGNGEVSSEQGFHKALAKWRYAGDTVTSQLTMSIGPDLQQFSLGGLSVEAHNFSVFGREDLSLPVRAIHGLTLRTGIDLLIGFYGFSIKLPFNPTEGSLDPLEDPVPYTRELDGVFYLPSPYLEAEYDLTSQVRLVPGIRVDPFFIPGLYRTLWIDPRLTVLYRPAKATLLKASAGRYGETPQPFTIDPQFGGSNLDAPYSLQYALGIEQQLKSYLSLEVTGFYSDLHKLVIVPTTPDRQPGDVPDFTNDGRGRNGGLELLLKHNPHNGFFGWISYTLQKAQRLDGLEASAEDCKHPYQGMQGSCWYPFDFDQTHILTLVASYDLPHQWTVGARFRYSTGVPYTRAAGAYYDVDSNGYEAIPAYSGLKNDNRIPSFNDLTLRVDKSFKIKKLKVDAFAEVLNVYNRSNPEQVSYSYNYKEVSYVYGLPIFPNLGVKGEF